VAISEMLVQELLVNRELRKEIVKYSARQKIMPINADDMGIVIPIPIMAIGLIDHIIEIIIVLQELFMEML